MGRARAWRGPALRCVLTAVTAAGAVICGASPAAAVVPTITSAPVAATTATALTWDFTDSSGATTSCELSYGGQPVQPRADCTSPKSYDVSGQPGGQYTLTVYDAPASPVDPTTDSATSTVDVAPVAPVITGSPTSPSNVTKPAWSFSLDTGATASCAVAKDGTQVIAAAPCTSPYSPDLSTLGEGSYTLTVTPTAGGVTGAAVTSDPYVLDTTAPAAPDIAAPTSPSRDQTPTFTFADVESGVTYTCTVTGPASSPTAPCQSSATIDLTGDPDGVYTLTVRAVDPAGNASQPATATYTLQAAAPPKPTVTADVQSPSNDRHPSFSVSDTESGLSYGCTATDSQGAVVPVAQCGASTILDLSNAADGPVTLSVTASDSLGNAATTTGTWTLDTTPPAAPAVSFITATPGNSRSPEFGLTDTDSTVTYTCSAETAGGTPVPLAACGSTTTLDLTGVADGQVLLTVGATDAAGNPSQTTTVGWTLDTTPPAAPSVTPPASPAATKTPTFTISDSDPDVVGLSCTLLSPTGATVASGPCPASGTFDTTTYGDGTYALTATASDAAGNPASTSVTWTRDTTAPATPVITAPASPGNSLTPSFAVSETDTATLDCRAVDASGNPVPVTACGATTTLDLTGQSDGAYALTVTATDSAGNSSSATASYTLDATPPPAPSLAGPTTGNGRTVPVTLSEAESGVIYSCSASGPGAVQVTGCSTGTPALKIAGTAADGAYSLVVTATDAAGNVSKPASYAYTLDTTAPAAPMITAPTGATNQVAPTVTVTEQDATATLTCQLTPPGGAVTTIACPTGGALDTAAYGDGPFLLTATATDAVGNSSTTTASWTRDTVAPASPTVTLAGASPGNSLTPVFTVTPSSPADTLTCKANDPSGSPVTATLTPGKCTLALTAGAPNGTYSVQVVESDAAGNQSLPASATYVLDTTPPAAPVVTLVGNQVGNSRTPKWDIGKGSSDTVGFACVLSGPPTTAGAPVVSSGNCGGSFTAPTLTGDGPYTLSVTAVDAAGNVTSPVTSTYTLDMTAPPPPSAVLSTPIGTPASAHNGVTLSRDTAPQLAVTDAEPGLTYTCSVSAAGAAPVPFPCAAGTNATDFSAFGAGVVDVLLTVKVVASDAAGNTSSGSIGYELDTVTPHQPKVSGITAGGPISTPQQVNTFTWDNQADVSYYLCEVLPAWSATPVSPPSRCDDPTAGYTTPSLPWGSYQFRVTAYTAAGGTASTTTPVFILDPDAAAPPVVRGPQSPWNNTDPKWTIDAPSLAVGISCVLTEVPARTRTTVLSVFGPQACPGNGRFDLAGYPDGDFTLAVTASYPAGIHAPITRYGYYTLDRSLPAQPDLVVAPHRVPGGVTWAFDLPPHTSGQCTLLHNGSVVQSGGCTTTATYAIRGPAGSRWVFQVVAVDSAGNQSPPLAADYRISAVSGPPPPSSGSGGRPAAPAVRGPSGAGAHPVWVISAPGAVSTICTLRKDGLVLSSGPCSGSFAANLARDGHGHYVLTVTAIGADGKASPATSVAYDWTAPGGPTPTPHRAQPKLLRPLQKLLKLTPLRRQHAPKPLAASAPAPTPPVHTAPPVPPSLRKFATGVQSVVTSIGKAGGGAGFPLLLVLVVGLFLLVQNRIDRRDPKLALAAVGADDWMDFTAPPSQEPAR